MCSNGITYIATCHLDSCAVTGHQWEESLSIFFCRLQGQVSVHIDVYTLICTHWSVHIDDDTVPALSDSSLIEDAPVS